MIVFLVACKFRSAVAAIKRVTGVKLRGSKLLFTGTTKQNSARAFKRQLGFFLYHATLSVCVGRDESILAVSGVPRNSVRGGGGLTNSVEDRERGSGGGSLLVRGSGGSCNLVQEVSFHIVKFS